MDIFVLLLLTMLSQTAEYALRAIVWLADHPDRPCTTSEIARGTRVPAGYLAKVLQSLGRAGLVNAQRGLRGGFTLARPANRLTMLDVVNAVDPIRRIRTCPLGIKSHGKNLCPLHRRLDDALAMVEQALGGVPLSDMLSPPGKSPTLCSTPPAALRVNGRPVRVK